MDLKSYLDEITKNSYAFVPLGISDEELGIFDNIVCKDCKQYNRYGNLDLIREDFPQFLRSIGNNDGELIQKATDIICKLISNIVKAFGKQTADVCVQSYVPNHNYDIPHWHMDGSYYNTHNNMQLKFGVALKGRQTMFYQLSP